MTDIRQIIKEMEACYTEWDENINNNLNPVTIQDLDFWIKSLKEMID